LNKSKLFITLSLTLLLIFSLHSCKNPYSVQIVTGFGRIVYLGFEGGFYGIEADDGSSYDPVNLPPNFRIEGLRVKFTVKILIGMASVHMWGRLVEIISIEKL
jgi:hypothetical protein